MTSTQSELDARRQVCVAYVSCLGQRDFAGIASCIADGAQFRAMTPDSVCEAAGPAEVVAVLRGWFGDADVFEMQSSTVDAIEDRMRISYTVRVREGGEWYVFQQQAFCEVDEGRIQGMNLLCSGFRPAEPPA
jgi:hypothetical protein